MSYPSPDFDKKLKRYYSIRNKAQQLEYELLIVKITTMREGQRAGLTWHGIAHEMGMTTSQARRFYQRHGHEIEDRQYKNLHTR